MPADNRHFDGDGHILDFGDKASRTNDIEGSDAKDLFRVIDAVLLHDLRHDWDGGVDGVGDDCNESIGAVFGTTSSEITDDSSIDVEEIVTIMSKWVDVGCESSLFYVDAKHL